VADPERGGVKRPQIIDTFPFFNELDMLGMRLEEIYDAVD
jgi:hypothetical protein